MSDCRIHRRYLLSFVPHGGCSRPLGGRDAAEDDALHAARHLLIRILPHSQCRVRFRLRLCHARWLSRDCRQRLLYGKSR